MRLDKQSLKFHLLTGILNIGVVVVAVGSSAGWWVQTHAGTVINTVPAYILAQRKATLIKQGTPTHITIPDVSINLPVLRGFYNNTDGSWTLDETHAFFATVSSPVNNSSGTSLIYGHNLDQVFGRLKYIKPGTTLIVKTDSNLLFTYTYESSSDVLPEDISVFSYTTPPNVILQTCSGDWDQLRSMHKFTFKSVETI